MDSVTLKKRLLFTSLGIVLSVLVIILISPRSSYAKDLSQKISLAYVDSRQSDIPDPHLFTHLIYAFGVFNDDNDKVIIPTPDKLRHMSELKEKNPKLKVILGIGGYKREGFSEMCRDKKKRASFVKSCKDVITKFNLDGIDLDWELPGTEAGGHTACPQDAHNYGLLVKNLRKSLGKGKWISFYSNNSGKYIDFDKMLPYVDYVNVSGYNLSLTKDKTKLYHQCPLYPSWQYGTWCVSKSIKKHLELGIPANKILLGIPFFGRGRFPFKSYQECITLDDTLKKNSNSIDLCWDDEAKVPYYRDKEGNLVLGFDDERSIGYKCDFIREQGLAGAFVWHYDSDYKDHRLAKKLREGMKAQDIKGE